MNNHLIAFLILALAGAGAMLYLKRFPVDSNSNSESGSAPNTVDILTAAKAEPKPAAGIKAQHVAAITAAILAATSGRGRILNITPAGRAIFSDTTRVWRTTAVVEAVGRRLPPSWKR